MSETILQRLALACLVVSCLVARVSAQELSQREEDAFRAAVQRVAPSVVRIETVGGLERVGEVLFGTGPTTGLVISDEGYIITSAFNFAQRPTSVLVGLSDGSRTPARVISTDFNRMLTLLKIDVEDQLAEPEAAPQDALRVGQWSIAVGRTFAGDEPNVSVGIVSALKRIWGKAIQTDAAVSPSNYGGPLIDLQGRVMGVLVPLSPSQATSVAGVEWYDSGIGFAVPLEHVLKMLPRMKEGEDLHTGIMGISLKGDNPFIAAADVAAVRANSPAYKAGLKAGDRIVEIEGQKTDTLIELRSQINRRYAGETISLVVMRDNNRIERQLELIDKLEPFEHAFLGLLPMRNSQTEGVVVRYVWPDSPADKVGLAVGDVIKGFAGEPVTSREELLQRLNAVQMGDRVEFTYQHGDEIVTREVVLAALPTSIPDELPTAYEDAENADADPAQPNLPDRGMLTLKLPEYQNECLVYVPENYDPRTPLGAVVWFEPRGQFADDALVQRWKAICDSEGLLLVAPRSSTEGRWSKADADFARKIVDQLNTNYALDPTRIVAHGHRAGGTMAYALAFEHRDLFRGVAVVEAAPVGNLPDNDPVRRLAIYIASTDNAAAKAYRAAQQKLGAMKFSVTPHSLGDETRYLDEEELQQLARWVDTLDRL
jgi:serine protease Do